MGNWLSKIFASNDSSKSDYLSEIGDKVEARVTNSGRQVIKASKGDGKSKYSATRYSNGTVVETKTTKR